MPQRLRLLRHIVFAVIAIVISPLSVAQGNALMAGKEAEVAKLAQKLAAIDTRRREDAKLMDESQQRMDDAEQELKVAKSEAAADGSELNQRRVKNAEFAFMLKQREFDRYKEKLQNYDVATKQTQQKIAALKVQIDDIKSGKAAVPTAQDLAQTQQELEAAKVRNEAAKQELARLRAMMTQANAAPVPTQAVARAPEPAAPAAAPTVLNKEQKFAIGQYERIAQLFREKGLDDGVGPDKEMLIDAMVDFWIESKRSLKFGYLGHGQYIVETKLRNGEATFVVDEQRWKYTVPEQDDNVTYMFLLDTTKKPEELYYFRKDLLLVE